ncbi:hypothetical protein ABE425_15610 [Chryseobacterium cucumeris]|uniref:hypothetical protein n=1 Tax=Chryseobacterium cucumeris TaxID=1813611 RepID=UPI00320A26B9
MIVLFSQIVYSQSAGVGINTTTPKSTFDINGKKDTSGIAVSTDIAGLQAPRLTRAELTNKGDALYGPDQKGAMVYITDVSGGNVTGQRSNISSVGYYYFDGSFWQKMVTTTLQPWHSTTTGTGEATVTENIYHSGNVGIGTTSPSTKLHVESSTSGAFRYADGTQGANKILMSDGNGNASWVAQNAVTPNIITGSIGSRLVTCSFAQITGSTISLPVGIWNIYVGGILYSGSANFISGSVVGGQSVSAGLPYFDVVLSPDSSNTGTFQFISSNSSKVPLVNITQNEYNVNYKVNVTSGVVKLTVFGSSCLPGISSYSSNFVVNKFNAIDN